MKGGASLCEDVCAIKQYRAAERESKKNTQIDPVPCPFSLSPHYSVVTRR